MESDKADLHSCRIASLGIQCRARICTAHMIQTESNYETTRSSGFVASRFSCHLSHESITKPELQGADSKELHQVRVF